VLDHQLGSWRQIAGQEPGADGGQRLPRGAHRPVHLLRRRQGPDLLPGLAEQRRVYPGHELPRGGGVVVRRLDGHEAVRAVLRAGIEREPNGHGGTAGAGSVVGPGDVILADLEQLRQLSEGQPGLVAQRVQPGAEQA
jgi:hypothetical protein